MIKKTSIALASAASIAAALSMAGGASAGVQGGIDGDLCTVAPVGNIAMYTDRDKQYPFTILVNGEQFRAHYYSPNRTMAWGHSTSTFPTDGWVSKYDLSC
jgi:hypothetical protein